MGPNTSTLNNSDVEKKNEKFNSIESKHSETTFKKSVLIWPHMELLLNFS